MRLRERACRFQPWHDGPRIAPTFDDEGTVMADPATTERRIQALINELRHQGISDQRVLTAMRNVPRDRFVPEEQRDYAWANVALPIGAGQTISQPYIVALMTQSLHLTGEERVLEVGTGSGYQAAILSMLTGELITIERHASLAQDARKLLNELGIEHVRVYIGDGTLGRIEDAPFDRIIVTAGAPRIPPSLTAQLSTEGGRLVIPIGHVTDQHLVAIERQGDHEVREDLGPVRFVPLIGQGGWSDLVKLDRNG